MRTHLAAHAHRYTFYKLLHDLERAGWSGPRHLDVRPVNTRVFPSRDIHDLRFEDESTPGATGKAEVTAWFGGLYGVDSPLPSYFDDLLGEDSPRSHNLRRYLALVGNRFYHLMYEIWNRMAPMFCNDQSLENVVRKPVLSLCGLGHLRQARLNVLNGAPYLVQGMRNRWGLAAMLSRFLEVPVEVNEFDPARVPLRPRERTRLGDAETAVLGRSFRATPYRETFATHVRIICGPLGANDYLALLPGGDLYKALAYMTFRYFPDDLEYRLELVLAASAVRDVRFRLEPGQMRLGATTVLGAERITTHLRIVREGVSLASSPEKLQEIVKYVESMDRRRTSATRKSDHGEEEPSLESA